MKIRKLNLEEDFKEAVDLWNEIGWLKSNDPEDNPGLKYLLEAGDTWVYDEDNRVEATAIGIPGEINYLDKKLPFHGLSGVVVSPVVRKQGVASRLVTKSIVSGYDNGAAVSGLLMFEQGYYDGLGYGTGNYDHVFTFDPSLLKLEIKARKPERISKDDWEKVHKSLLNRKQNHGAVSFWPEYITRDKLAWSSDSSYGLGYYNEAGEITHMMWLSRGGNGGTSSHGPLVVEFMTYQNYSQFLELLGILKNLGDQIFAVKMKEPAGIQLQDYLKYPRKQNKQSDDKYGYESRVFADWQIRILDLEKCIRATSLKGPSIKFNLELYDPLEKYLDGEWQGLSGNYQLELGDQSDIKVGKNSELPTLKTNINSFSRLWLGVLKPSVLALNDGLSGPDQLLADLDQLLACLPDPKMELEF